MTLTLVLTGFISFYLGYMTAMILTASRDCLCGDCENCSYKDSCKKFKENK